MKFITEIWHPNSKFCYTEFCNIYKISPLLGDFQTVQYKLKTMLYFFLLTVEKNGDVCISILHEPGDDKWGYEKASERWLPVHTVETILISVISMLADPNDESPANVDAAVSFIVNIIK